MNINRRNGFRRITGTRSPAATVRPQATRAVRFKLPAAKPEPVRRA